MKPTPAPDLSEARRLLGAGLKLVELVPYSKRPVGNDWNHRPVARINPNATGYGILLAENKLCSIDPDNVAQARIGMRALGFDLDALMDAGVRTLSTRVGSGGRSTFAAEGSLSWLTFRSKAGQVIEFRADSPNLQDCVPGVVYHDIKGNLCSQTYANGKRFDDPPPLPDGFFAWWERCSTDIEFLRDQEARFFAALGFDGYQSISTGKGGPLAFPAPGYRTTFNAQHKVEDLLEKHGYTWHRDEQRWAPPNATGAPGIRAIPNKSDLWRSDHASDPLMGTFDAWTAFVVLEHGGDVEAAMRACNESGLVMDMAQFFSEQTEAALTAKADAPQPVIPFDLWSQVAPVGNLPRGVLPETVENLAFSKPNTFPPAALAAAALAACSMAASDHLKVEINMNWRERFTIWVGLVGSSACGKSPTISTALRPLATLQAEAFERHENDMEAYRERQKAAKRNKEEFDEDPPVCERYLTHNATIEALTELERTTQHGLGLVHDELSALIAAMDGQYKEKSGGERGHWLALYDGGAHTTDRIGRGSVFVKNHSAAILGGITIDKLRGLVATMSADGLMSRLGLITMPPNEPSDDMDAIPYEAWKAYEQLVQRIARNRPHEAKSVPLTTEARELLGAAKKRWQAEALSQSDNLPRYSERLGKLPGLAARVALGFALIEAAEVPGHGPFFEFDLPTRVEAHHMSRAVEWVRYQSAHDLAFYAAAGERETVAGMGMARKVAAWFLRHDKAQFKLGEVTRGILEWRGLKSVEQAAVLELLEQLGWIVGHAPDNGPVFRGMSFVRGAVWAVNPHAREAYAARAEHERRVAAEARNKLKEAVSGN